MESFDESVWPGYVCKRNKHGKSFKNTKTLQNHASEMKSLVFRFTNGGIIEKTVSILDELKTHFIPEFVINMDKNPTDTSPGIQGRFTCPECSRCLKSEAGLKNHIHIVHVLKRYGSDWRNDSPKTFPCHSCPKMFKSDNDLWQHTVNRHGSLNESELELSEKLGSASLSSEDYEYVPCPICSRAIESGNGGMEMHLESLKPAMGMQIKCPLCQISFIETRALVQHYKYCRERFLVVK